MDNLTLGLKDYINNILGFPNEIIKWDEVINNELINKIDYYKQLDKNLEEAKIYIEIIKTNSKDKYTKEDLKKYNDSFMLIENEKLKLLREQLAARYSIKGNKKEKELFELAYKLGHSKDYNEIENYYIEMLELIL